MQEFRVREADAAGLDLHQQLLRADRRDRLGAVVEKLARANDLDGVFGGGNRAAGRMDLVQR